MFYTVCFTPFSLNPLCQFTPLLNLHCLILGLTPFGWMGLDSVVGIATRYRLDGPGIESRLGQDFPYPFRLALGPTQPPVQWGLRLYPGGKAAGMWR
jgi:hypothetical protein